MLTVYLASIINNKSDSAYETLPEPVKQHIKGYCGLRFSQSVTAYKLAEKILGNIDNIRFTEIGKPFIKGTFLSISHSNELVAFSNNQSEIGIDIEKIRKINGLDEYLSANNDEERILYFCIKESVAKKLGKPFDKIALAQPIQKICDGTYLCGNQRVLTAIINQYALAVACDNETTISIESVKL